jgi:vacuolar-type H+-ATPase subunit F/Vma7
MVHMPEPRDLLDPAVLDDRDAAKIAVIGESGKVSRFGLAGAIVLPAEGPEAVLAAWHSLDADVAVVVLTSRAARTLAGRTASWPLTAVMPP